ncbi:preprotein translocase subunit SecG [Ahrensia marina]|uniref:preprotein translocase subunit SecG n=1 Tax=Ahrensia marina TaxID=1514904 RepID=UPI0035CF0C19
METLETVLIVVHLLVVVALVAVVLLQRSEGGALGIGGGGGGNFMSSRGRANVLTRATAFLALGFFITSISLTVLAQTGAGPSSILDSIPDAQPSEDGSTLLEQIGGEVPAVDTPDEPQIPTTQ